MQLAISDASVMAERWTMDSENENPTAEKGARCCELEDFDPPEHGPKIDRSLRSSL